ncbi:MAG: Lrp/AsnC family transcriptional regulator [Candidatus Aenigmarchaeota archaeon]|nr:Lrp/AsnC family transcriptional regulator [Candidatus Aenigmarchaeota archaeon]
MHLDLTDRKILHELDINSRQHTAEIAKKLRISKQVAGFRIDRLLKEEIISSFHAIIDVSKLGFSIHKVFLRLQNADTKKELLILKFLSDNPNIVWVASCDGKYDLAFGTWAKDMAYLDRTMKEMNKKMEDFISEKQVAPIVRGEYFIRDYLIESEAAHPMTRTRPYTLLLRSQSAMRKSFFGSEPLPAKIDAIDWKILFELGKNARSTSVGIAEAVSISADAVADRIRKLEKSGIVKHYNIVPNEAKYPYMHYKILIGLKNLTEIQERHLEEYCRMHPNIVYIVKTLGPWEFEIDVEIENPQKLRELMMDLKTRFKDIIKDYSSLSIHQVHKYNFCPSVQVQSDYK